jgi:VanZ family protein
MRLRHFGFDWLALAAFCALIFYLSAQPYLPMASLFKFQDKLDHFTAYGVMAALAWRAFRHLSGSLSKRWLYAFSVVFCSLYGISDEWHQSFVPGREPSAADWLADTSGAILSLWLMLKHAIGRQLLARSEP